MAVIVFCPTGSDEVVMRAPPFVNGNVPNVVVPTVKVTEPDMECRFQGFETLTTKVTGFPLAEGFCDDLMLVVVVVGLMTWMSVPSPGSL